MKKLFVLLLLTSMLVGCGAEETFEVVEDVIPVEPVAVPQQFYVTMPDDVLTPTFQNDSEELYVCQDYTISKQILPSGDLEKTVNTLTGLSQEDIQMLKTFQENADRYDLVWTAAGEDGLQLGRACILDDGNYHYVLSVMAAAEDAGALADTWQQLMESFSIAP